MHTRTHDQSRDRALERLADTLRIMARHSDIRTASSETVRHAIARGWIDAHGKPTASAREAVQELRDVLGKPAQDSPA